MRSIITISREFGSGGREIGKKLADDLAYLSMIKSFWKWLQKRAVYVRSFLLRTTSPILTAFFSHWSWVITL